MHMDNFAVNFSSGLALVLALVALCIAILAYRKIDAIFIFVKNKKTRTVVVNTDSNTVTVIKELAG